jgi:hypothetical protein
MQVNYLVQCIVFHANHEMAHQMGYASESECNFIGFVKTIIYIQYSGYSGFWCCLSNWQSQRRGYFKQLLKTVHPGILKTTRKASSSGQYDTIIDKGFHALRPIPESKTNKDGMEGYKFVNLMVNYTKRKEF